MVKKCFTAASILLIIFGGNAASVKGSSLIEKRSTYTCGTFHKPAGNVFGGEEVERFEHPW